MFAQTYKINDTFPMIEVGREVGSRSREVHTVRLKANQDQNLSIYLFLKVYCPWEL